MLDKVCKYPVEFPAGNSVNDTPEYIEIKVYEKPYWYHPKKLRGACNHFMSDWSDEIQDLFVQRSVDDVI